MKMNQLLIILFLSVGIKISFASAAVDDHILIRGKIGNAWTAEKVKITDNFDQTYYLPRIVFPKKFIFQNGKSFTVEITNQQFDQIVITK
jgi:hypothetical protein